MTRRWPAISDTRLAGAAWIIAALILAVGVAYGARNELAFRGREVRDMQIRAEVLGASIGAALSFDDRIAMRQYLHAQLLNPKVAAAAIYDADGRRVEQVHQRAGAEAPSRPAGVRTGFVGGRPTAVQAVAEQGQVLGWVVLEGAPDTFAKSWGRHIVLMLMVLMAVLLLTLVTRAAGRLARANQSLRDEMAARVKAEAALLQSQKMEALGQLTGGIAHDFNNLLQTIHGSLELIRLRPADTAKVQAWAEQGLAGAERGSALTRQLLAFSRTQRLEQRPVDVAEMMLGIRELLAATLGSAITLELDTPAGPLAAMSDRTQLELAMLNLAINARDAMPLGGRVAVRVRAVDIGGGDPVLTPGPHVELSVSDTGVGMPPEVLERALEPFFTTKEVGKGTGLGLSQVYGVARQAGGDVRISSAPAEGAAIRMLLPRAVQHHRADTTPEVTPHPASNGAGRTVLVVDDDAQVRAVTCETLAALGYRVVEAGGGLEALALLEAARPDVMLLDYAMPGLNGAETAERARRARPGLPIILASGHADSRSVETVLGAQAVVLPKPFDVRRLGQALLHALDPSGGPPEAPGPDPHAGGPA